MGAEAVGKATSNVMVTLCVLVNFASVHYIVQTKVVMFAKCLLFNSKVIVIAFESFVVKVHVRKLMSTFDLLILLSLRFYTHRALPTISHF